MRTIPAFVLAVTLALSPAYAQDQLNAEELRTNYATAFNAGNASELAQLFTEDTVMLPPDADRVEGRAGVERHYETTFEQAKPSDLQIRSHEIRQLGDAYLDIGSYSMTALGPDGQAVPVAGDYMTLVERGPGDQWLISRHIWNQDMPR